MLTAPCLLYPSLADQLSAFATSKQFWGAWQIAFGQNYDRAKAERLRQQWANRDFRQLPKLQTLSSQVLGPANGAYAASTNTIYLSETFLKTAPTASIVNALLEEIGHYVDATINASDSPGDEGAIFAALVQGEQLTPAQLLLLKAENDWTTLQINGKSVVVEQAVLTGTSGSDTLVGTAVDDVISGLAGNDSLLGGSGNDQLFGGLGSDTLVGGAGNDLVVLESFNDFTSTVNLDVVTDFVKGSDRVDLRTIGIGDLNTVLTLTANDLGGNAVITTFYRSGIYQTRLNSVNKTVLQAADFVFKTDVVNDLISGTGSDDDLFGAFGSDTLQGSSGNDRLFGEQGNDQLTGGAGNDTLFGGSGDDTAVFSGTRAQYSWVNNSGVFTITDSIANRDGIDTLNGIQKLQFSDQIVVIAPVEIDPVVVSLSVSPGSVVEDGAPNLLYTFTRTGPLAAPLSVNYLLVGGTATFTTDYTQTGATSFDGFSGTVTFAANAATATITVDPVPDSQVEQNETVVLTLASGAGYAIGTTNPVTGTIQNDDFPVIAINDVTVVEGKDANALLTLSVDNPSPQQISVNFATSPVDATANGDYTTRTGTLILPANATTVTLAIPILNDNLNEANESFLVTLSAPINATLSPDGGIAEVTITDTWDSAITRILPAGVENLRLTGVNNINGTGNANANTITGNSGINLINGAGGADTLTGNGGADIFVFQFGQSTLAAPDRITDFTFNSDKIDLLTSSGLSTPAPLSFSRATNSIAASLTDLINQVFADANGAITGNQSLAPSGAALVQVATGPIAGNYLVINDAVAGFQAANDLVVNITGSVGQLPGLGAIPIAQFFV
ncbi:MAG: Calx-beta domain-containing protein [Cyanobacteriota bacterium]